MNRRNRKRKEKTLFDDLKAVLASGSKMTFWQRLPKMHQRALMILTPLVLLLFIVPLPQSESTAETDASLEKEAIRKEVAVDTTSLSEKGKNSQPVTKTDAWQEYTVQAGDTLAKVFRSNKLPMADLQALVAIEGLDKPLSKIKQGQLVRYKMTAEGHLDILQLEKAGSSVMFFRLSDGGYGRSK